MEATMQVPIKKEAFLIGQDIVRGTNKSISDILNEYLFSLSSPKNNKQKRVGPITKSLSGIMKLDENDIEELQSDPRWKKYLDMGN